MIRVKIPVGTRFNRLITTSEVYRVHMENGIGYSKVDCVCDCGNTTTVLTDLLKRESTKSCGCLAKEVTSARVGAASGKNSPNWKGGRYIDNGGYVHVYVGQNGHPRYKKKYVLEHVLVMETRLGRLLYPGENVHHKNGVKTDNRPENLELWVTSQPSGQRPEDLVTWANQILERYGEQ